jgi:hypothetical protein
MLTTWLHHISSEGSSSAEGNDRDTELVKCWRRCSSRRRRCSGGRGMSKSLVWLLEEADEGDGKGFEGEAGERLQMVKTGYSQATLCRLQAEHTGCSSSHLTRLRLQRVHPVRDFLWWSRGAILGGLRERGWRMVRIVLEDCKMDGGGGLDFSSAQRTLNQSIHRIRRPTSWKMRYGAVDIADSRVPIAQRRSVKNNQSIFNAAEHADVGNLHDNTTLFVFAASPPASAASEWPPGLACGRGHDAQH